MRSAPSVAFDLVCVSRAVLPVKSMGSGQNMLRTCGFVVDLVV